MKISIITVCYNSEKYIRSTIDSILNQTHEKIEYIVVDGLSQDRTIDIIKEYEPRFNGRIRWISEKDAGLYDAMNKGINMSSGDVIAILNSDDIYYDNEVIADVVHQLEKRKTDALYGNLEIVRADNTQKIIRKWISTPFIAGSFKKGWHLPHPTFFVKKSVYEKYGAFDTSFDVSADFEFLLRVLEVNKISVYYYDRFIVKMRYGGESTGSLQKIFLGNKNVIKAFKKNDISISLLYPIYRIFPKLLQFFK